ncbi:MAG: efflux RND transporter periplasmic adaptor subunit [Candidatus Obscuribacterales bacterium]
MTTRFRENGLIILFTAALCGCTQAHDEPSKVTTTQQTNASIVVTKVTAKEVNRKEKLPADLIAYRDVAIYPKVPGFVKTISVDRGSIVKSGQLLVSLMAPELNDQKAQSANQAKAALEERNQSKADLESLVDEQKSIAESLKAEKDTYNRLKEASAYPGIIAGNDLEIAQQKAAADEAKLHSYDKKRKALEARIRSFENKQKSALDSARSSTAVESYLQITAPFDGVITERNVHEGSFVNAPTNEKVAPLLRIQHLSLLRLVVPVPEADIAGIVPGANVSFTVAYSHESGR